MPRIYPNKIHRNSWKTAELQVFSSFVQGKITAECKFYFEIQHRIFGDYKKLNNQQSDFHNNRQVNIVG